MAKNQPFVWLRYKTKVRTGGFGGGRGGGVPNPELVNMILKVKQFIPQQVLLVEFAVASQLRLPTLKATGLVTLVWALASVFVR